MPKNILNVNMMFKCCCDVMLYLIMDVDIPPETIKFEMEKITKTTAIFPNNSGAMSRANNKLFKKEISFDAKLAEATL